MNTYQEYLKMPLSLTFEEMNTLHEQIIEEIGNDEISLELFEDILSQAEKYNEYRSHWFQWSREEKMEQDPSRSRCHDSLIVKFDVLARWLRKSGKAADWRDTLGDANENPYTRKRIGDFACYLIFVEAVLAR